MVLRKKRELLSHQDLGVFALVEVNKTLQAMPPKLRRDVEMSGNEANKKTKEAKTIKYELFILEGRILTPGGRRRPVAPGRLQPADGPLGPPKPLVRSILQLHLSSLCAPSGCRVVYTSSSAGRWCVRGMEDVRCSYANNPDVTPTRQARDTLPILRSSLRGVVTTA